MNKAEIGDLVAGFGYGLTSCFFLGWSGVIVALGCSALWWMAGRGIGGTKLWRIIGCPIVLCMSSGHTLAILISMCLQFGWMSVGWGVPSTQPPDAGSWLGRIFGAWTKVVWFAVLTLVVGVMFL